MPKAPDRDKYLARQRRYNASLKGQARHARYEERHPERKQRWSANMESKKNRQDFS